MKNAVIYARFSSHGQNEQTIDGQVRICREYAENMGLNVVKVYEDKARTGTNDSRPAFQSMIRDARGGSFQYIIVYMLDRFARNRRDSIMYKEMLKQDHNIKVLSATQQISDDEGGEFYEMFLEWNDERYSKRLSKRVKTGFDTSVENGTFTGGYLLHGYKLVETEKKGVHRVVIDEPSAEIIRFVFNEYARGVDKKEIARKLNAKGERFQGKQYLGRTFDKWLSNRKYTGKFQLGDRLCTKQYPQIIDETTFEKVQKRLASNRYFAGSNSARIEPYYLTGKLYCGHCGTRMVAGGGTSHMGYRYYYYVCRKKEKNKCVKSREEKDELEKIVTQAVQNFLSDKDNAERSAEDTIAYYEKRTSDDGLKSIETKIDRATKEVETMTNAFIYAQNDLLRTSIEKKMKEQQVLLEDLQNQKTQILIERGQRITKDDILEFIANLIKGDPEDKDYQRKLIDNIVLSVYAYDGRIVTYLNVGADVEVEQTRLLDKTNEIIDSIYSVSKVQTQSPASRQNVFSIVDYPLLTVIIGCGKVWL